MRSLRLPFALRLPEQANDADCDQHHAQHAEEQRRFGGDDALVEALADQVADEGTWQQPQVMDELQIHADDDERDHLDHHQDEPQHEQGIAQLVLGYVRGIDRHDKRCADQRGAADIAAQHQQAGIHIAVLAAEGAIEQVADRIGDDDAEDDHRHHPRRQRQQADHADQLRHDHDLHGVAQIRPVDVADARLFGVFAFDLPVSAPGDPAREDHQVYRDQRQEDQRIVVDQQQEGQGKHRAAKAQPGAHEAAPDEDQADQDVLVPEEVCHGVPSSGWDSSKTECFWAAGRPAGLPAGVVTGRHQALMHLEADVDHQPGFAKGYQLEVRPTIVDSDCRKDGRSDTEVVEGNLVAEFTPVTMQEPTGQLDVGAGALAAGQLATKTTIEVGAVLTEGVAERGCANEPSCLRRMGESTLGPAGPVLAAGNPLHIDHALMIVVSWIVTVVAGVERGFEQEVPVRPELPGLFESGRCSGRGRT